ncbi:MAG: hypothetical protein ABIH92_03520 [Nanoarchaeota archaeon]
MKNRIGQISIFIILALFLIGAIIVITLLKDREEADVDVRECEIDTDCRPAECCDAQSCVSIQDAPDCSGEGVDFSCVPGCRSGATGELGCDVDGDGKGIGFCQCVNQKCLAALY